MPFSAQFILTTCFNWTCFTTSRFYFQYITILQMIWYFWYLEFQEFSNQFRVLRPGHWLDNHWIATNAVEILKKENEISIEKCLFNCCCFIIHWSRIFSLRKRVHFSTNTIILSNVLCASWTCTLAPLITYFVLKNDTWLLLHFWMT